MNTNHTSIKKALTDAKLINLFIIVYSIYFVLTFISFLFGCYNLFNKKYFSSISPTYFYQVGSLLLTLCFFILIKKVISNNHKKAQLYLFTLIWIKLVFYSIGFITNFINFIVNFNYYYEFITHYHDYWLFITNLGNVFYSFIIVLFLTIILIHYKRRFDLTSFKNISLLTLGLYLVSKFYIIFRTLSLILKNYIRPNHVDFVTSIIEGNNLLNYLFTIVLGILWMIFIYNFVYFSRFKSSEQLIEEDSEDPIELNQNKIIMSSLKRYHLIYIGIVLYILQISTLIYAMKTYIKRIHYNNLYLVDNIYLNLILILFIELGLFIYILNIIKKNKGNLFTPFAIFLSLFLYDLFTLPFVFIYTVNLLIAYNINPFQNINYIIELIDPFMSILTSLALTVFVGMVTFQFHKKIKYNQLSTLFSITIVFLIIYSFDKLYLIQQLTQNSNSLLISQVTKGQTVSLSILIMTCLILSILFWIGWTVSYMKEHRKNEV